LVGSTHKSFLDPFLISYYFPIVPLAKKSILLIPIFGWNAYLVNTIFVDRKNKISKKNAIKKMEEYVDIISVTCVPLGIFPEGTRNPRDREILPFKNGIFDLSLKYNRHVLFLDIVNSIYFGKYGGVINIQIIDIYNTNKPVTVENYKANVRNDIINCYKL